MLGTRTILVSLHTAYWGAGLSWYLYILSLLGTRALLVPLHTICIRYTDIFTHMHIDTSVKPASLILAQMIKDGRRIQIVGRMWAMCGGSDCVERVGGGGEWRLAWSWGGDVMGNMGDIHNGRYLMPHIVLHESTNACAVAPWY